MFEPGDRGVSDVIGFILVFSLVSSTVAIISLGGLDALRNARDSEQFNNAERAFDVLADNMEDIYQEGAPHRATEINLQDAQLDTGGTVVIHVTGRRGGSMRNITNTPITVTPIVWESTKSSDTRIVYSLGAVMRSDGGNPVVLRNPPFILQDDRMVLTVVNTGTDTAQSFGGSTIRVRGSSTGAAKQIAGTNPYSEVWVNITSPRAAAWERYFERSPATADGDDEDCYTTTVGGDEKLECKLENPDALYVAVHSIDVELEQ